MMNWFSNVIAYLKDNPEGYWFKRKLYGWGWTPATREGWLITLLAILLVIINAVRFETGGYTEAAVIKQVLIPTIVIIAVLIFICIKTGESPRWQWGEPLRGSGARPSEKISERSE